MRFGVILTPPHPPPHPPQKKKKVIRLGPIIPTLASWIPDQYGSNPSKIPPHGPPLAWRGQDHREENEVGKSNTYDRYRNWRGGSLTKVICWTKDKTQVLKEIQKMKSTNRKSDYWKQYYQVSNMISKPRELKLKNDF